MPPSHHSEATLKRDPDAALSAATRVLTDLGFHLDEKASGRVRLSGPGLRSTRQNPLLGASEVLLRESPGKLSCQTDMGAVGKLARFATVFPLALGFGIGLLLAGVQSVLLIWNLNAAPGMLGGWKGPLFLLSMALLPVLPWIFLGPWIGRRMHRRTALAFDTLVHNAAQ